MTTALPTYTTSGDVTSDVGASRELLGDVFSAL